MQQYKGAKENHDSNRYDLIDKRDVPEYFCDRCGTPVETDERVDMGESERIGSFRYGSETEQV